MGVSFVFYFLWLSLVVLLLVGYISYENWIQFIQKVSQTTELIE